MSVTIIIPALQHPGSALLRVCLSLHVLTESIMHSRSTRVRFVLVTYRFCRMVAGNEWTECHVELCERLCETMACRKLCSGEGGDWEECLTPTSIGLIVDNNQD